MKAFYTTLFLFLTSTTSFAMSQYLLEPSVGYRNETVQLTDRTSSVETKLKSSMPVFGLKLGYRSPIGVDIDVAYDYSYGKMDVTRLTEQNKFTHQNAAAELGINALGLMKIYLGYSFLNQLKLESTPQLEGFKLNGPSYLVGVQFKIISVLNIGAQYNLNQFNRISGSGYTQGDDTEKYFSKVDAQDYKIFLSLSL
jgi:hypothetical protein